MTNFAPTNNKNVKIMETKKFKINKPEGVKSGKKLSMSSILSKAGFTIAGGAAGAASAAFAAAHAKPKPTPEDPKKDDVEDIQQEAPVNSTQTTYVQEENTTDENLTEPQPVDNAAAQANNQLPNTDEEVDPDLVAQSIAQEIDESDIDADNIFTPDGYDYAYMPDGTRQTVIVGHTPDGEQFVLADVDGDGIYNDIFDINGNFVVQIDGLSISDLMDMIDATGGYIAGIDEPWGDDPTAPETIVTSEDELAEVEEVDEEELLAQLTEEEGENSILEEVIDEPEDYPVEDEDNSFDEEPEEGVFDNSFVNDEV